jgi:hypothetical protein
VKRAALLVLATGLLVVACGQASGHTASIVTPPDSAFHAVTDDLRPTHPPAAVIDDLAAPAPPPRPTIRVPAPRALVVSKAPKPRPMPTVAAAKAYALRALGSRQYSYLNEIALHESAWNPHAVNRSTGAYGIPQALPGSKMATVASDWHDNPVTQVKWMIRYVYARYGSASAAWSYWLAHHWY